MNGQYHEDSSSGNWLATFAAGLLLGGLVGAVAMLLLAPRAGAKTRSQLQKQGAKLRHQMTEGMEEVVAGAGDKAQQITDSVQQGVGDLQQHAKTMLAG